MAARSVCPVSAASHCRGSESVGHTVPAPRTLRCGCGGHAGTWQCSVGNVGAGSRAAPETRRSLGNSTSPQRGWASWHGRWHSGRGSARCGDSCSSGVGTGTRGMTRWLWAAGLFRVFCHCVSQQEDDVCCGVVCVFLGVGLFQSCLL